MENVECDKNNCSGEETSQLSRNRSFKSKQLVRSQALCETHSPPRVASPAFVDNVVDKVADNVVNTVVTVVNNITNNDNVERTVCNEPTEPSHSDMCSDAISVSDSFNGSDCKLKQPVEIQITGGAWDRSGSQRQRAKRWLGNRDAESTHLLSNNPRVACVCGSCAACPHCRGRRRKQLCPTKQDSGIVCSDDCPDCSDLEHAGGTSNEGIRKSASLDAEDQTFYCRCPERKEKPKPPSFSRTDSDDRAEPTGADLVNFLKETLNKNPRDRITLLKIEKELHSLVTDTGRCIVRFPVMTSYGRMLVHRCASLFQLSHHLDQTSRTSVLVSKSGTSGGRIPCTGFKEWCTTTFPPSPQRSPPDHTNAKSILKRSVCALDEGLGSLAAARSRSLEQREKDYERVRRRIFSSDNCAQDETQWPWLSGPVKLLTPEGGRNKLLKVQSLEGPGAAGGWRGRGAVSKSHSFGGYAAAEPVPTHPRLLSRQGDLASSSWRLSPSSSGYKTLSLRSTDSATPSPTGGASPEPGGEGALVWAVTDLAAVPLGASVIHPQTGRPITNPDGSIYRFDPANPPILYESSTYTQDNKIDQNCEKKRGKLEKQHSLHDNECECQPADECRSKCCCECRRHDTCQKNVVDKQELKQPQSPAKPRYEPPTNQNTEPRQQFEPANQKAESKNLDQSRSLEGRSLDQSRLENEIHEARTVNKSEGREYQYNPGYRQEEQAVTQAQLVQQEVPTAAVQAIVHNKLTTVPIQDNIRPVSMTNMVYTSPIHQQYAYINQCRVDQSMQYQVMQHTMEEQKVVQPTHNTAENTFRIDPSYPYAAVDYSACGACVDTSMQHRSYSVPYGQVEVPQTVLPPAYPLGNVILPQPHMQHYQFQEPVQWGMQTGVGMGAPKVYVPELYPLMQYSAPYPQYNVMYPQVIPQQYQLCQPIYPVVDKPDIRRNSFTDHGQKRTSISGSARATPQLADARVPYEEIQRQNEIAVKIQQIKEQMSQMNVKEKSEEFKRNNGNGILGSYPSNNFNGRPHGRNSNDDNQLSTAARAIVNSIRNMQAKNTYQHERTSDQYQRPDRLERDYRPDRGDYRPERGDYRPERGDYRSDRGDYRPERDYRRRGERGDPGPLLQYRPPYLLRQMSPGTWCRRSPGPVHPVMNQPRRPHPDSRNGRR